MWQIKQMKLFFSPSPKLDIPHKWLLQTPDQWVGEPDQISPNQRYFEFIQCKCLKSTGWTFRARVTVTDGCCIMFQIFQFYKVHSPQLCQIDSIVTITITTIIIITRPRFFFRLVMGSSEKLCLQWDDFKENITFLFKALRNDKEFTWDASQLTFLKSDHYSSLNI